MTPADVAKQYFQDYGQRKLMRKVSRGTSKHNLSLDSSSLVSSSSGYAEKTTSSRRASSLGAVDLAPRRQHPAASSSIPNLDHSERSMGQLQDESSSEFPSSTKSHQARRQVGGAPALSSVMVSENVSPLGVHIGAQHSEVSIHGGGGSSRGVGGGSREHVAQVNSPPLHKFPPNVCVPAMHSHSAHPSSTKDPEPLECRKEASWGYPDCQPHQRNRRDMARECNSSDLVGERTPAEHPQPFRHSSKNRLEGRLPNSFSPDYTHRRSSDRYARDSDFASAEQLSSQLHRFSISGRPCNGGSSANAAHISHLSSHCNSSELLTQQRSSGGVSRGGGDGRGDGRGGDSQDAHLYNNTRMFKLEEHGPICDISEDNMDRLQEDSVAGCEPTRMWQQQQQQQLQEEDARRPMEACAYAKPPPSTWPNEPYRSVDYPTGGRSTHSIDNRDCTQPGRNTQSFDHVRGGACSRRVVQSYDVGPDDRNGTPPGRNTQSFDYVTGGVSSRRGIQSYDIGMDSGADRLSGRITQSFDHVREGPVSRRATQSFDHESRRLDYGVSTQARSSTVRYSHDSVSNITTSSRADTSPGTDYIHGIVRMPGKSKEASDSCRTSYTYGADDSMREGSGRKAAGGGGDSAIEWDSYDPCRSTQAPTAVAAAAAAVGVVQPPATTAMFSFLQGTAVRSVIVIAIIVGLLALEMAGW